MQFIADGHKPLQLCYWNGINQEHYMHHLPRRNPPGGTLWNFSLLRQHLNKFSLNKNLLAGIKECESFRPPPSARRPLEKRESSGTVQQSFSFLLSVGFSFPSPFHFSSVTFVQLVLKNPSSIEAQKKFHSIYWTSK